MIHHTAVIESGAELGKDVAVGPFAYIQAGARIGDGSQIGPHATVFGGVALGRECRVHAGAVIGDLPQDLGFKGGQSYVRIGDRCVFREGVTVHRGTQPETATEIGSDCYLMACAHVAHNDKLGSGVIMANAVLLGGYVEVGDRVFISGTCLVHQFSKIGRLAMLGGGSGVSKDVPPFCTMKPQMPNTVLGLNVVGMRRAGLTPDQRKQIKAAFRLLYFSGLNSREATLRIRASFADGPALELAEFVEKSTRGVCAPARRSDGGFGEAAEA